MSDYDDIFPDRAIRIVKTGVWPAIFQYLGALLLLATAGFIGVWQAPGIVSDWLISQDPVTVGDAVITDGECSTSRGFFVDCSAHVAYEVKGKAIERDISLMFLDFGSGDYEVDVVRSAATPARVTLSLGLDMLWNRTLTGLAFCGGLGAMGIALFSQGLRSDRNRRRALRASKLHAVPVPVTIVSKVVGGKVVRFQYGVDRKQNGLQTNSRFKKSEEPLWLQADGTYALAVKPEGAEIPVILDSELCRLDLSPTEKAEAKAKIEMRFSTAPA